MGIGGSATGGKGGAVTGGKGGTTTGGQGGTITGGAGGVCADLTNCSGTCVDTDTDEGHCGACNAYCEPGEECTNGECTCRRLVGASNYLLIDDLEDDNGIVGDDRDPQLRVGYWYVYNDQSENCTQIPEADPAGVFLPNCGNATCSMRLQTPNGSRGAAHMEGSGCSVFGAGMGFDFANCNMRPTAYDASAYNGIRFWYQSTTPLRFNVSMMAGIPSSMGGTCTDVATECYNHHGVTLAAAPTGMTVTVLFSTLTQDFGTMRAFDKTQLAGLQFSVTQNLSFFVWVDDIYFTF